MAHRRAHDPRAEEGDRSIGAFISSSFPSTAYTNGLDGHAAQIAELPHLLPGHDIDRSVAFYEKLGFEELRRMPIRDEATNVFMGLPGDGARLELTSTTASTEPYEMGTGYGHIAISADDLDGTLERARRARDRAGEAAVPGARRRLTALLRARPGWVSDRDPRTQQVPPLAGRGSLRAPTRASTQFRSARSG